ncbi:hypothetical protein EI94DRAFT_1710860 [Lactarius quietus]|nr:hypothetical protein EI94DRAFT_1710860 [Lactarius quietus]
MPPKTHFTIPLGNTVDFVTRSRWSMQDIQTTECVVPQLSKKKTSTKPSHNSMDHGDVPQTLNDTEERYPLHIHEDQEDPKMYAKWTLATPNPRQSLYTNGAMVGSQGQIPPSITGDGGVTQAPNALSVIEQWRSSALIALEEPTSARPAAFNPTEAPHSTGCPNDRQSLYASIIIFTGICTVPWPSRPSMSNDSGGHLSSREGSLLKEERLRTEASGNPLLTVVHQSGVFNMEVLYCICPNAGEKDKQLFQSGMFPSSFKQIETAFTFSALEYFLNRQSGVQDNGPAILFKASRHHQSDVPSHCPCSSSEHLVNGETLETGCRVVGGHQDDDGIDGSMAIFCPACPQPGINLPDDWKIRYNEYSFMILMTMNQLVRTFIMMATLLQSICDADLEIMMSHFPPEWFSWPILRHTRPTLKVSGIHSNVTGIGATAFCHVFFVPTSVVDFQKGERQVNMDYSLCKALSYNVEDIPVALVMYDIMCQYGVHLSNRVEKSPELSIANSLELWTGIGLFHIHGHQDSCLPHYSPSYISGAKQVDGEIIETFSIHIEEVEENGKEGGDPTTHGQTSWIASGIRIQELQLAIKYQLWTSGSNITTDATIHSSLHIAIPRAFQSFIGSAFVLGFRWLWGGQS